MSKLSDTKSSKA